MSDLGFSLGCLRTDIALSIFKSGVLPICLYATAILNPQPGRVRLLDSFQMQFGSKLLSIASVLPSEVIRYELALVHMKFVVAKAKILVYSKVMNNEQDNLTKSILSWLPLGQGGFIDDCTEATRLVKLQFPLQTIPSIPYFQLGGLLNERIRIAQYEESKTSLTLLKSSTNSYIGSKPSWGIADYLTYAWPTPILKAYLAFRTGHCGLRTEGGSPPHGCRLCDYSHESHIHIMLHCRTLADLREDWVSELKLQNMEPILSPLSDTDLMHFLLGAGSASLPSQRWALLQKTTAKFLSDVLDRLNQVPLVASK
jgi:hypothetical protein